MNIGQLNDFSTVGIMYGTLRDMLHYIPKNSPESYLDKIPGPIAKELEKVHYHRLRTVRCYAKLLKSLHERWISMSSQELRNQ